MKNNANPIGVPNPLRAVEGFEERLLNIYWEKKNLEEFLPQIASYSSQKELVAITISQLSIIEKQIVLLLKEISEYEN
jgi:hypothetical protein